MTLKNKMVNSIAIKENSTRMRKQYSKIKEDKEQEKQRADIQ